MVSNGFDPIMVYAHGYRGRILFLVINPNMDYRPVRTLGSIKSR
jgi:hypothetical protein